MSNVLESYPYIIQFLHTDFFSTDSLTDVLISALFAMVAGFGFSYACNPPKKVLISIVFIAGLGYLTRSLLSQNHFFSLAGASFCASLCMGLVTMFIARYKKVPAEVIVFPALLPMFPGSYGYRSILSLLTFTQNSNSPKQLEYLLDFFNNLTTMLSVSISLVAGVLVTFIIFYDQSFKMTRGNHRISIYQIFRDLKQHTKKH